MSLKSSVKKCVKRLVARGLRWRHPVRRDLPAECWGLEYSDRSLTLRGHRLSDIAAEFGTPIHVVDEERLVRNFTALSQNTDDGACDLFYSYKTNPLPGVLKRLHALGAGAEVVSEYELWLAQKLGVPPERIIYNGPAKSLRSLETAVSLGILLINLNHFEEIDRLAGLCRRLGQKTRVAIRVTTGGGWQGQFGIPIAGGKALAAYRHALDHDELDLVGIHCHRGVLFENLAEVDSHMDEVLAFLHELWAAVGSLPEILDLGGSVCVPTVRPLTRRDLRLSRAYSVDPLPPRRDERPGLEEFPRKMVQRVESFCGARNLPVPRIVFEPGRALTGDSQMLLTRVVTTRAGSNERHYAILDAGVSLAGIVKSEFHQLLRLQAPSPGERQKTYRIVGPLCHAWDVLYPAWTTGELHEGDGLAIMDAGAYFIPEERSFSFTRPGCVSVGRDGTLAAIRRSEKFDDVVALDSNFRDEKTR